MPSFHLTSPDGRDVEVPTPALRTRLLAQGYRDADAPASEPVAAQDSVGVQFFAAADEDFED